MQLAVVDNRLEIYNADDALMLQLVPRRSVPGEQTRIVIEPPGWPPIQFLPEAVGGAPAPAEWVWRGDHEGAQALAELAMRTLRKLLGASPSGPTTPHAARWRGGLMDATNGL